MTIFIIINLVALWLAIGGVGVRLMRQPRALPGRPLDECSCRHTWAFHDKKGECQATRPGGYSCRCVRYDGIPPAHVALKEMGF